MNIALDSWCPHCYPKGWKQDPYGVNTDISEDNLVGGDGGYFGQITGTPGNGAAAEKGEPKIIRAA